jgi:hypothetical protein
MIRLNCFSIAAASMFLAAIVSAAPITEKTRRPITAANAEQVRQVGTLEQANITPASKLIT